MTPLLAGLVAGLVASTLSSVALADDQGPVRSHFSQDRSHFSQNQSQFRQGSGGVERHWHRTNRPGFGNRPGFYNRPGPGNRPGFDGRPGFDNRPGFDGRPGPDSQWGYDGRPGFGWHRPQPIDPDERLRRDYERLYDGQRRQFEREQRATVYGNAPRGNGYYGPDRWHRPGGQPPGYRPPSTGYPLPPHGYPLPGQSRPPAFNDPGRSADLYSDPRGPAPATPYSR
ncbi:hypothetical protein [Kushneria indalinina]|uniref:Nickel/cobalt transporter regulator n=1 Tax=Kushneria indalinina DSM 14324 TaxID=1122140 RepID=A0A3D9DWB5_9GAMM|nr:hypothetical protein [Kushneria indalinina]REC94689.1 hypothetical protein C8D72_1515 [Kushneria indalinina DSM 14324]